MTAAWASLRSMVGLNKNNLVTCQFGFIGNYKLELPKCPTVELRPLFGTVTLTAILDTLKVFQHNEAIWWEAINEAAADSMQVGSCPTALLVAQPFPSPFGSRAFALQGAPSGTKPFATLNQLYARNLKAVRSNKQVNFAEVNTNDVLRRFVYFRFRGGNGDVQVKVAVPVALKDCKSRLLGFKQWQVALPYLYWALNPLTIIAGKANPKFVALPEQPKKVFVQVQRVGFESQKFKRLLFGFENFVGFGNTVTGTDSKVSMQPEALSDFSVGQMVQGNRVKATSLKRNLTNSVAGFGKNINGVVQSLLILWRRLKFGSNGQFHRRHRLNYSIYVKTCKGGEKAAFLCRLKATVSCRQFQ